MKAKELCIKCNRDKPKDDRTWFCQNCMDKIIDYGWNYHKNLQDNYGLH